MRSSCTREEEEIIQEMLGQLLRGEYTVHRPRKACDWLGGGLDSFYWCALRKMENERDDSPTQHHSHKPPQCRASISFVAVGAS